MSRLPIKDVNIQGSPFRKAFASHAPKLFDAFVQMEKSIEAILEPELMELLRLRAAANNDCQY